MTAIEPPAESFLREHRLGMLAPGRRDGSPQQALVAYDFDGADVAIQQSRWFSEGQKRPTTAPGFVLRSRLG